MTQDPPSQPVKVNIANMVAPDAAALQEKRWWHVLRVGQAVLVFIIGTGLFVYGVQTKSNEAIDLGRTAFIAAMGVMLGRVANAINNKAP